MVKAALLSYIPWIRIENREISIKNNHREGYLN